MQRTFSNILVTGGAGFIGVELHPLSRREDGLRGQDRQLRRPHLRGQPRQPGRPGEGSGRGALRLRAGRHMRPGGRGQGLRRLRDRRGRALRGREPRGPLHPRPRSLHPHECHGDLHPPRSGARGVEGRGTTFSSTTSAPTRSSAPWARRALHRTDSLRSALALFGEQGRQRPPGARLSPHLRPPVTLSNCSNNYGPYQFPEKLIPLMILNMLEGKSLPVYGDGRTCATGSTSRTTPRRSGPS